MTNYLDDMENGIESARFLDEDGKLIEGFFFTTTAASDGADEQDEFWGGDFGEDHDLPPLTDEEIEEAETRLDAIFGEALKVDTSRPLTEEHKLRVAQVLVDYVGIAMEQPSLAARLADIRYIQLNPCQPVSIEMALETVETHMGSATANSVHAMLCSPGASAAVHRPASFRPS